MTQQVQLWEITDDKLKRLNESGIDYEQRLEDWLVHDISILNRNLLVIGRQVPTSYRGLLDLLCLDRSGDIVVVELKKDRTPRDVSAQVLDYASWARGLSRKEILEIAEAYLKRSLADTFREAFEGEELPADLNLSHRSIIVARSSDDSTERIVRYLSDLKVPINLATFQHFEDGTGRRLLARIFIIEPEETETNASVAGGRTANRTIAAVSRLAHEQGIGELYDHMHKNSSGLFVWTSYNAGAACELQHEDSKWRRLLFVEAVPESGKTELPVTIHATRIGRRFGINEGSIADILPAERVSADEEVRGWGKMIGVEEPDAVGWRAYFSTTDEIDRFTNALRNVNKAE